MSKNLNKIEYLHLDVNNLEEIVKLIELSCFQPLYCIFKNIPYTGIKINLDTSWFKSLYVYF